MKEPKVQFSKLLTIGSLLLFVWTLIEGLHVNTNEILDTTIHVTAITVSGGIFGLCLKSYMSKAKAENIYKVQRTMYEDIMDIKLRFNEKMMQLSKTYNLSQDDVDNLDVTSPINDGVDNILNDMRDNFNNHLADTKMEDEVENF